MDKDAFWQLIEQTYDTDAEDHNENLKAALVRLGTAETESFSEIYDEIALATYRWELWAVAHIIAGDCSDDHFTDFLSMVIRRGREFCEAMLAEPEAVALRYNVQEEDFDSMFDSCIPYAYEELTGKKLPPSKFPWPADPSGTNWNDEDLPTLYPRLSEKFG